MSLIDHIEFAVKDAEVSKQFYEQALKPLGIHLVVTIPSEKTRTGGKRYGFGQKGYPILWIHDKDAEQSVLHLALKTERREIVDAVWDAAIKAGGRDYGKPAIRHLYHDHYYAAYILDPDGNNLEIVCQSKTLI